MTGRQAVACGCDAAGCPYDALRLVQVPGTHDRTFCTVHAPDGAEDLYEDGFVPAGAHLPPAVYVGRPLLLAAVHLAISCGEPGCTVGYLQARIGLTGTEAKAVVRAGVKAGVLRVTSLGVIFPVPGVAT